MLFQYSLVGNSTNNYHEFSRIADASIDTAAKALKAKPDESKKKKAIESIKELPAYPDVKKD